MQLAVHAVDPDKIAASVATTATTFSVLLVLVIGVPFSLWLDVCLIGCYSRDRRSGSIFSVFVNAEISPRFHKTARHPRVKLAAILDTPSKRESVAEDGRREVHAEPMDNGGD